MALDDANMYGALANLLYASQGKRTPSERRKEEIKAAWIEAFVLISEIYAQTEIGENIKVDIPKIAVFVNSPDFENQECYQITDLTKIYEHITNEILGGFPIFRFLKLSKWQLEMCEKDWQLRTNEEEKALQEKYPCKRCIHLYEKYTSMGMICKCKSRKRNTLKYGLGYSENPGFHDYTKTRSCRFLETEKKPGRRS